MSYIREIQISLGLMYSQHSRFSPNHQNSALPKRSIWYSRFCTWSLFKFVLQVYFFLKYLFPSFNLSFFYIFVLLSICLSVYLSVCLSFGLNCHIVIVIFTHSFAELNGWKRLINDIKTPSMRKYLKKVFAERSSRKN